MPWYRVYFLSRNGDIRNVDEFVVTDDDTALALADRVHEAVSDLYAGYELWQDSRRIYRCAHPASRPFLPQHIFTQGMQAELLRRLKILQSGGTAFGRSLRLAERLNELEDVLGPRRRKRFG